MAELLAKELDIFETFALPKGGKKGGFCVVFGRCQVFKYRASSEEITRVEGP